MADSQVGKPSLFSFSLQGLQEHFVSQGFPKFSAKQVYNWLYQNWEYDPDKWSNISKKLKEYIKEEMDMTLPKVVWHGLSKDGTRKFLIGMRDQQTVETVAIPARDRLTL